MSEKIASQKSTLIEERKKSGPSSKKLVTYLSSLVTNKETPPELRAQAANYLLPYKYSKCGTRVVPRYIDVRVDLPRPTTLEQANNNIAYISELKAQGQIDLDFADSLVEPVNHDTSYKRSPARA